MSWRTKEGLPGNLNVHGMGYKYNVNNIGKQKKIKWKVKGKKTCVHLSNSGYLKSDSQINIL